MSQIISKGFQTISIPVPISQGGTGTTSLPTGVVFSNGTILSSSNGTNGQTIIASSSGIPVWASITSSDGSLTLTPGANSLNIGMSGYTIKTSWSPTLSFGGSTTGISYATRNGSYVEIEGVVIFSMDIVLSNKGSQTGNMSISGLPFTPAITTAMAVRVDSITFSGTYISAQNSGSNIIFLNQASGAAGVILDNTAFTNSCTLQASGIYIL